MIVIGDELDDDEPEVLDVLLLLILADEIEVYEYVMISLE